MSTLYRPVLIETAEQAEALPDDAIVIGVETGERYTKTYEGDWWGVTEMGTKIGFDLDGGDAVQALVPIEAEEVRVIASGGLERDYHGATVFNHTPDGPRRDYRRTEFHTPWESA